jgi:hypothetical protein
MIDKEELFRQFKDVDYSKMNELMNKNSSSYRKAQMLNKKSRKEENIKSDPLTSALKEAVHITDIQKDHYITLAELYLSDMQDNIFSNQFKLAEKYDKATADEWNEFLSDRIVRTYIQKHKRTLLKAAAEDNLADPTAKNKRDNLKLIENIEEKEQQEAQKNVVIIRIPDIYDEE